MIIDSPIISGSLILTGSAAFTGSLTLSGSMNTIGTITATTIVVQTITSSIDYITGSSINGSLLSNTHLFTGSLYMTGGLYITDSNIGVNTTAASSPLSLYYPSTGSDINYIKMEMPSWGGSTNFKKNIIWHDSSNVVGAIGMSFASPYTYMDFHSFYNSAHTTGSLMRIQGNGLIGIGTTAPSFRLSFGGDTATTIGMNQSILGTAPALTIKGADSTTGTNNEGGAVYISAGLGTGNGATSNIIFSTAGTAGSGATRQSLTERMRITSAGVVGIGTSTAPVGNLNVWGGSSQYIVLTNTAADGVTNAIQGGIIGQARGYGNNLAQMASILFRNKPTAPWYKGEISFNTNNTDGTDPAQSVVERMRIASDGVTSIFNKLILGTSNYVGEIQYGTSGFGTHDYNAGNGKFTWLSTAGAVAGTIYYSFNADGAGARFTIANNGAATLVGALTQNTSDKRLKDNVKNIDNALNKVMALNGVTFDWNDIAEEYGWSARIKNNDIGVIAQEVQAVLPQAIDFAPFDRDDNQQSKSGENYLTVQYEKIVPLLIESIKELNTKFEEYKATHP
jgi:hypothetical protein